MPAFGPLPPLDPDGDPWSGVLDFDEAPNGVLAFGETTPPGPSGVVVQRWDGAAWVVAHVKRWSGAAWVDTTVARRGASGWET